jgi:ABC-type multidrug transport system fused ATPase/permease subunit
MAKTHKSRMQAFWEQINEPLLNPDKFRKYKAGSLRRVFSRYFLRRYWGSILLVIIMAGLGGGGFKFFLAWTGRYVADDIVQVHLISEQNEARQSIDPSRPDENRTFDLSDGRSAESFSRRHDASVGKSVSEKLSSLGVLALLVVGAVGLNTFFAWYGGERRIYVGQQAQFKMRHRLYEKLQTLPMSYHDASSVGSQMTYLFSDVRQIQSHIMLLMQQVPAHLVTIVLGAWILFSIDPSLTLLVLLALPAYGFTYTWFHSRQRTVNRNLRERQGRLDGHIANRIRNFYLVKSFVKEKSESLDFLRRSRVIIRDTLNSAVLGALFSVVCTIITGLCMAMVLWLGALRVRDGQLTLGELLMFYGSAGFMFSPIASLSQLVTVYHRLEASCGKIMRVLDEPISLADPTDNTVPIPDGPPEIRFENVTLNYDSSCQREAAIRDLSFTLPSGKTLCVMGPSGSGKSTLARLASRIYDPTEGQVTWNGIDLRQFRMSHLRRRAGFVNQEPIIFDGTIRDNIRYGSEQETAGRMVTAAQYAQIHEYITRLPEQYETLTCERGLTLSGGQKQRVNLARVLLYDPPLLVLDDCTSALDAETEARLVKGFEDVLSGRTVICVSHRISIAMRCDFVMMLDEGRLVEIAPPDELIARGGAFADLAHEQTDRRNVLQLQPA